MSVFPPWIQARMWWASHSVIGAEHPAQEHTPCMASSAILWPIEAMRSLR